MPRTNEEITLLLSKTRDLRISSWAFSNELTMIIGQLEDELQILKTTNNNMRDLLDKVSTETLSIKDLQKKWKIERGLYFNRPDLF